MPIVPSGVSLVSTEVSDNLVGSAMKNPAAFGAVPEAVAHLGGDLSKIGLGIYDEVKKAEALDAVSQVKQSQQFQSEDYLALLKKSAPDGYIRSPDGTRKQNPDGSDRTLTQEYKDWSNKNYRQAQDQMPSGLAQKLYRDEMGDYYSSASRKLLNEQYQMQTESYKRNTVSLGLNLHNRLVDTPSVDAAYNGMDDIHRQIRANQAYVKKDGTPAGILSAAEVDALSKDVKEKVTEGLYQGYKNQILDASPSGRGKLIDDALRVLRGQDTRSRGRKANGLETISEVLPEEKKGQYEAELLRMKKDSKTRTFSEISSVYQDARAGIYAGRPPSGALASLLNEREKSADTPDELLHYKEQRTRIEHQLTADQLAVSTASDMRKLPPSQWGSLIGSFDQKLDSKIKEMSQGNPGLMAAADSNFGQEARSNAKAYLESAQNDIAKEIKNDAADYVLKEFKGVAASALGAGTDQAKNEAAVDQLIQKQKELEIPAALIRPVTKETSHRIGLLLNTNDPEALAASSSTLRDRYGKNWDIVYEQVVADNALMHDREGLAILNQFKDHVVVQGVSANIVNKKAINEAYESAYPETAIRNNLSSAVNQQINPYIEGVVGASRDGNTAALSNAIRSIVETEAKKLRLTDKDSSDSDIAKRSVSLMREYSFVEAGNSKFITPAKDGDTNIDSRIVKAYADSHRSAEALETMKINVPKVMSSQPDYAKKTPDEQKRLYFRTIEQRGFWRNDPNGRGILLFTKNDDGTWALVKHSDGSPVNPKFRDMVRQQDTFTNKKLAPGAVERTGEALLRGNAKGSKEMLDTYSSGTMTY